MNAIEQEILAQLQERRRYLAEQAAASPRQEPLFSSLRDTVADIEQRFARAFEGIVVKP